jgi:hypothetical protein
MKNAQSELVGLNGKLSLVDLFVRVACIVKKTKAMFAIFKATGLNLLVRRV